MTAASSSFPLRHIKWSYLSTTFTFQACSFMLGSLASVPGKALSGCGDSSELCCFVRRGFNSFHANERVGALFVRNRVQTVEQLYFWARTILEKCKEQRNRRKKCANNLLLVT